MKKNFGKAEPIELFFDRSMISGEMELLFRHIMQLPEYDPPHLDDANEFIQVASDDQLSEICKTPPGLEVVVPGCRSLRYSSELKNRLFEQLADIDLSLPNDHEGWLADLLEVGQLAAAG